MLPFGGTFVLVPSASGGSAADRRRIGGGSAADRWRIGQSGTAVHWPGRATADA